MPSGWSLRYRSEHLAWQHSGADIRVSDGEARVEWSGGPGADRAIERALAAAERISNAEGAIPSGAVVATFHLYKQAPGAELLAGVSFLTAPADTVEFTSRLNTPDAVPAWEPWWNGLIEQAVREEMNDGGWSGRVELIDALAHPVDSKDLAWRIASRWAIRYGFGDAPLRSGDQPA